MLQRTEGSRAQGSRLLGEIHRQLPLLLVEPIEPLGGHRGYEEEGERPGREPDVHERKQRHNRCIYGCGRQNDGHECANGLADWATTHAAVSAAKRTSSASPVTAPTSEAATRRPNSDGTALRAAWAANPVAAPPIKRVLVYVAHLSRGARSGSRCAMSSGSPSIEAAPTTPAASGPNSTAAKSVGRRWIDCSSVDVRPRFATANRTLIRSATAAARQVPTPSLAPRASIHRRSAPSQ